MNEEKPAGFTLPAFPRRRRLMLRRRRRRRRARSHNGLPAERAGAHRRVVALFGIAPVPGVACRRKSACRSSRTRRNLNNALHDAGLSRVCHCAHHDARCERRPPEAPALIPAGAMMEGTGRRRGGTKARTRTRTEAGAARMMKAGASARTARRRRRSGGCRKRCAEKHRRCGKRDEHLRERHGSNSF